MSKKPTPPAIAKYLAAIGSQGGKTTGSAKVRGTAEYYQVISRKAAAARKRNAKARAARLTKSDKPAPRNPSQSARKQPTKRQP